MAPRAGLEPAAYWLTANRSTDWANEEYIKKIILVKHTADAYVLFRNYRGS